MVWYIYGIWLAVISIVTFIFMDLTKLEPNLEVGGSRKSHYTGCH